MDIGQEVDDRTYRVLEQLRTGDKTTEEHVSDLIRWGYYSPKYFSQFGLGLDGYVFRQQRDSVRMTVKVKESGVPLVGFITSATTVGSVEQMFDLLERERLTWQKDKYPWI